MAGKRVKFELKIPDLGYIKAKIYGVLYRHLIKHLQTIKDIYTSISKEFKDEEIDYIIKHIERKYGSELFYAVSYLIVERKAFLFRLGLIDLSISISNCAFRIYEKEPFSIFVFVSFRLFRNKIVVIPLSRDIQHNKIMELILRKAGININEKSLRISNINGKDYSLQYDNLVGIEVEKHQTKEEYVYLSFILPSGERLSRMVNIGSSYILGKLINYLENLLYTRRNDHEKVL